MFQKKFTDRILNRETFTLPLSIFRIPATISILRLPETRRARHVCFINIL